MLETDTDQIRIFLVDDQEFALDGLAAILGSDPRFIIVGKALSGAEALARVDTAQPDIVLLDLNMPKMDGIITTRRLTAQCPTLKVLIVSAYADEDAVFGSYLAGASGYIVKHAGRENLIDAIRVVNTGSAFFDAQVVPNLREMLNKMIARQAPQRKSQLFEIFTEREISILRLLSKGYNNQQISEALSLALGTVRNYVSSVIAKTDAVDRTQLAIWAISNGLLDETQPK